MRIVVAAIGRLKQGPAGELAGRYRKRAADAGRGAGLQAFDIVEIRESRAGDAARRMLEESIAIANVIPDRAVTVILDERGESMSSASLAARPAGAIEPGYRLRGGALAASAGANHAAGAALPRRHHPGGTSLPPGMTELCSLGFVLVLIRYESWLPIAAPDPFLHRIHQCWPCRTLPLRFARSPLA